MPDFRDLRQRTAIAIARRISGWSKELTDQDYVLDRLYRELSGLPPRPEGHYPLVGFFPPAPTSRRLFSGITIPEYQLNSSNYIRLKCAVLDNLTITGGFAEPYGHSFKKAQPTIMGNGKLVVLPKGNRNLGLDYCTPNIKAWYDGTCTAVVWERGYGNRAYFIWNVKYIHLGQEYTVYGAFAHASSFSCIKDGKVKQGDKVGTMGATGGNYAPHIDYRQWIVINAQTVDLSPNALEKQIHG